jgi:hypothetical protein
MAKVFSGARGGTRTRKIVRSKDFKSFVYTIPPPGLTSGDNYYNVEAWPGIEPGYAVLQTAA